MVPGAASANWPPLPDQPSAGQPYPVEHTTQSVQAAAEGVVEGDHVEFMGEKFRLADKVGIMPMLAFANASKKGLDSDDMEGLAAMYSLIRSVIWRPPLYENGQRVVDDDGHPQRDEREWDRFARLADDEQAEGEDVMDFVSEAMSVIAARPRKPRGLSSGSSRRTSEKSRDVSSLPATIPGADGLTPVAHLGH